MMPLYPPNSVLSTIPEHMSKVQKEIMEKYMTGYAKVKAMHEAYNK